MGSIKAILFKPMVKVAFLHGASAPYTGRTLREQPLRGIESGTVLLAEEFVKLGHDVSVFNRVDTAEQIAGVHYRPFSEAAGSSADLVVVNNNARELLSGPEVFAGGRRIVWFRNPVTFSRLLKKGNLSALYLYRPDAVFLSKTHDHAVSRLLPFTKRHIIELGTDSRFLPPSACERPPGPNAVFFSEFYRGIDWALDVWRELIWPRMPDATFHIIGDLGHRSAEQFHQYNIVHHPKMPKQKLSKLLRSQRLLLYQGHKDEAGCNTAIEAYASGLPIVTLGIGVMGERVDSGSTGFIAHDAVSFAEAACTVLSDDELWMQMHKNALKHWSVKPWSYRAKQWEDAFMS